MTESVSYGGMPVQRICYLIESDRGNIKSVGMVKTKNFGRLVQYAAACGRGVGDRAVVMHTLQANAATCPDCRGTDVWKQAMDVQQVDDQMVVGSFGDATSYGG